MTTLLEDTFQVKITSHRAGRWSLNEIYARVLENSGYLVDCSVTPYVSWKNFIGDPTASGGADYSHYPDDAYFLDLKNIDRPGDSKLLEVPMTIFPQAPLANSLSRLIKNYSLPKRFLNHFFPSAIWLRPKKDNLKQLLRLVKQAAKKKYLEFMLHSSELMPGGNRTFQNKDDIERLYRHLKILFSQISNEFKGATFVDFYEYFTNQ